MERAQGGLTRSIVKTTSNIRRSVAALAFGGAAVAASLTPANAAPLEAWETLAQCESNGNWAINTGNGFYGGLQFTPSSWAAAGGSGSPAAASKAEQIRVAENLLQMQGWGAWPACAAKHNLYAYGTAGAPAAAPATYSTQSEYVAPVAEAPVAPAAPVAEAPVAEAPVTEAPVAEAPVVAAAPVATSAGTYTVVAGDTLSEIAYKLGYNGWEALAAANADIIPNPDVIEIGQVLTLPAK